MHISFLATRAFTLALALFATIEHQWKLFKDKMTEPVFA